ncbi:alpha/beta-type small acid-soluble spore protein [Halobacillus litoralis]|uniref:alpha/beta-type small acid-soluble spore protein n=1 Tax=Halobacillus litoralis TaxID=45668 RepID=UPI001CD473A6|nr:alpha/beta-type small acid-soluble spore protein [Halobacillus litoralis]MCA0971709.1 alpha/beta-type small acid-soluble spore protein [Halobacillus litoralis]
MSRKNKILVPEARAGLDQLKSDIANTSNPEEAKYEIAKEKGIPMQKGYNGQMSTRDAGKVGGSLGGQMVKELVRRAEQQLQQTDGK